MKKRKFVTPRITGAARRPLVWIANPSTRQAMSRVRIDSGKSSIGVSKLTRRLLELVERASPPGTPRQSMDEMLYMMAMERLGWPSWARTTGVEPGLVDVEEDVP